MDPDIGAVLLLHPVLDHIFAALRYLAGNLRVHRGPVVGMHAVGNHTADVGDKFRLTGVAEVLEHPAVDKVKRKALFDVSAHHSAGQRIAEQFLALPGKVLHDQCLGIMFSALLADSRFREPQGAQPPASPSADQGEKSSQPPAVLRIFKVHPCR